MGHQLCSSLEQLPTGLSRPGYQTVETQITEADSTQLELAINSPRATAQNAAMLNSTAEFGLPFGLLNF